MNWGGRVNVNGQQLSHLRFEDDVVCIAGAPGINDMLQELNARSKKVSLKINA